MEPAKKKGRPKKVQEEVIVTTIQPAKEKPVRKIKENPVEDFTNNEQPSGPRYIAVNMDSVFLNEHPIIRFSGTIAAKMTPMLFHKYVDTAAAESMDHKAYIAKKILKALGFRTDEIELIEKEIIEYKTTKRQQLYHRVDKNI